MFEFPRDPVSAQDFFEKIIPEAFEQIALPEGAQEHAVKLGVRLEGEGGGEWLFALVDDRLQVTPGSRADAAFSLVQSVADWRDALWGERGGAIGKQAGNLFRPGSLPVASAPKPELLKPLEALDGLVQLAVTGGEGGDWHLGLKLGPGEIPAEPNTTVSIAAADAAAMEKGELDPMQAFMTGQIQVAGDIALVMQLQLVLMQAAAGGD